jgi:hypothetical protein
METAEQGFGKSRALTHCQKDVEIRERRGGFVLRCESLSEKNELRASGKPGPIGAAPRYVLPIIQDSNFHQMLLRVGERGARGSRLLVTVHEKVRRAIPNNSAVCNLRTPDGGAHTTGARS